jgi:hypothetical protein
VARRYYSSNAVSTTLSSGVNSTDLSITVALVTGYPTSFPFTILIDDNIAAKEELCEVSATTSGASTMTFTVTRGIDGTTGVSHTAGAVVKLGVSARDFDEPNAHINASTGVHSVTGSVVGTTDTQTLTNKTLTSPTINSPTITSATITSPTISSPTVTSSLILDTGAAIVFEGSSADAFETTLTVTNPTADRTITLPNATTTLVGTDTAQTLDNKTFGTLILDTGSVIIFEGATADAFETTLTVADPTADRTVTIPDATTTLVGNNTTDTLTNKSISGATNTLTAIPLTTAVTGSLPVANGGTAGTTAATARSNLSAAASGANSDITSLTGLTTALTIGQGGTGRTSFSNNAVAITGSGGALTTGITGTAQQIMKFNASNEPVAGTVTLSNSSAVSTPIRN